MKNAVAAIEFGTSRLTAVIGRLDDDGRSDVLGWGVCGYVGYTLADGWHCGPDELSAAISSAIKEAEKMAGQSVEKLYIGVPDAFLAVRQADAELAVSQRVTASDIEQVMAMAVPDTSGIEDWLRVAFTPAWFSADGERTMEPLDLKCARLGCRMSGLYADKLFVDELTQLVAGLGYGVSGFLSPSLGQAMMLIPSERRDSMAVLIDCGYLITQVMIVEGDALRALGVLDDGAGFFTAELASRLELTMDVAEQLKRRVILSGEYQERLELTGGHVGGRMVFLNEHAFRAIEPELDGLVGAIKAYIASCGIEMPEKASYYLTGGGLAMMPGAREFISARLGVSVQPLPLGSGRFVGPNNTSALGLLELALEDALQSPAAGSELISKIKSIFKK